MSATDDAILDELIIESKEHLENIEPNLLTLEKEGGKVSAEIINTIFRAIHSIKGGFGFYGLKNIQALSHAMESVLMQVRDGKMAISPSMTDALLAGVDKLRTMLDDVKASETCSIEAESNRLLHLLQEDNLPAPPTIAKKNEQQGSVLDSKDRFGLTAEQICGRMQNGQHLYHLSILCPADLGGRNRNGTQLLTSLAELGHIIAADPPQADIAALTGEEEQPATLAILYATVLDHDFLAKTIGIADSQCVTASIAGHGTKEQETPAGQPPESGEGTSVLRKTKKQEKVETIRVKVSLLNNLMALAGELVLGRNQMKQALNRKISSALSSTASLKRFEAGLANSRKVLHSSLQSDPRLKDENKKNDRLLATVDRELGQILNNFRYSLGFNLIDMPGISGLMQNVDLVTSKLQNTIMNTRMQPIDAVFSKFPRIIRDMAKKLGKEIQLTVEGSDVELDKSVIETLGDPLTHLIRNCADHGIETPTVRTAAGKTSFGKILLRAHHEAGMVNIDIIDDGAGLDVERIVEKAISTGSITREEAAMLTEQEAMALILTPGLSTAKVVSDVSGRGVGMDVVRTNIEKLGGEVVIDSTLGKGTRINLKLPLTLAIIPSLIISAGGRTFAVPQVNMEELVRIRALDIDKKIEEIQNKPVLRLRNKLLPLIRLDETLGMERTYVDSKGVRRPDLRQGIIDRRGGSAGNDEDITAVTEKERRELPTRRVRSANALNILVLKVGADRYGLIVERLFDNEEIVVKPLSSYFSNCPFYCGATIMGDGRVAMILDAPGLAEAAGLRFADALKKEGALQAERYQRETMREAQSLLLFRNGTSELFAVNLAMVARIEKIHSSSIRQIGSLEYITHEDSSMRILRLHHFLPVQEPASTTESFYVIIPKLVTEPMGIVASKIVDIIATSEEINRKTIRGPGIIGSLSLPEGLIVVLNIYSLFEAADPERARAEIAHGNLRGLKVLLAEDTGFFRTVIHNYLESVGCEVAVANDGLEAWEMLGKGEYDLLVTDIVMPGLDGIELTERVRDSAAFRHMPVIALTSLMGESDRARIMAAGVDAYETKLDREHLLQTIGDVMSARSDWQVAPAGRR
ncbi:MAG: chemotaxis protein CheW [Proteobacteria bacterium]|nr:chemotaxis protein CheW [Pseudomonadota bacterium]MBU0967129.1 chemotaxis protein CheW [Pseudomonadota bacterium]